MAKNFNAETSDDFAEFCFKQPKPTQRETLKALLLDPWVSDVLPVKLGVAQKRPDSLLF